ncbi:MAG: putative protein kinase UbiB [Alphaproteobacteria bacterium MarineAlpha5_Bin12]|nr:ABC transporter ATP-binding protein [Pelagibacteraceae bacterium]PPR41349.1 MAG: putative protein kinase UbiB [Alphaproteobacteria bacterium MarineAlpha5_Bin12]|tara:strand:+ start:1529 stop:2857 length:1329 start_codon:yes stop_codon:yes gene_type:complete
MIEKAKLSKQIKRYAEVSGVVGKLATKLAGKKYFGISFDKDRHAKNLTSSLGKIKGPLMKVAQLTSTIPDILPSEYAKQLAELQSNAPPMGQMFVKRRMINELGRNWINNFKNFENEASKAASLGQVHKAYLKDGTEVACKLQYPDMNSIIEADLKQLKLIFSVYQSYNKAIKTNEIFKEVKDRLLEELDYKREKNMMKIFDNIFYKKNYANIPKVYNKLCTDRLLTMDWLNGEHILKFKNQKLEIRNKIAKNMFLTWYFPFYNYGIIHGDPHLGNYTITKDYSVNLFDYGCMRIFKGNFIKGVIDLYNALQKNDKEKAVFAYQNWGFKDISKKKLEVLNKWAGFIYSPLMKDKVQKIQENTSGTYGAKVASEVHKELRKLGGIQPPREFVFMDRAAVGLGSVFMHLKAELNWYRIFNELIENFSSDAIDKRQKNIIFKKRN